jgi:hypothetical protein
MAISVPITFSSGVVGTYHMVTTIEYSFTLQQIDFAIVSYVAESVTLAASVLSIGSGLAAIQTTHLFYPLPNVTAVPTQSLYDEVYTTLLVDPFFNSGSIAPVLVS